MPSPALAPLPLPTARSLCTSATLTGRIGHDLRDWLAFECSLADDTDDSPVGHLRVALWHACEIEADNRLICHVGQALADALATAEIGRGDRYGYAVGSAGQVR